MIQMLRKVIAMSLLIFMCSCSSATPTAEQMVNDSALFKSTGEKCKNSTSTPKSDLCKNYARASDLKSAEAKPNVSY